MSEPYFSIIIPVYKVERYLKQCIESILCQNMKDYEIILVDDGSPDRCPEMCDHFSTMYHFIRTVHQANGGQSSARNSGLSVAQGKYILFLDSDDFWCCNDALSVMQTKLQESNADVLIFGKKKYYQLKDTYDDEIVPVLDDSFQTEDIVAALMQQNIYVACAWDKVIRHEFIKKNKIDFVIGQVSEDIEWCAKILLGNPAITVLPKCIYVYRQQNSNSITANIGRKNIECVANVIMKYSTCKDENILNYFAEQYILWMTISNCVKKSEITDLLKQMKKQWFLMDYCRYPHVRVAKKFRLFGFEIVRRLLGYYKKTEAKAIRGNV